VAGLVVVAMVTHNTQAQGLELLAREMLVETEQEQREALDAVAVVVVLALQEIMDLVVTLEMAATESTGNHLALITLVVVAGLDLRLVLAKAGMVALAAVETALAQAIVLQQQPVQQIQGAALALVLTLLQQGLEVQVLL